MRVAYTHNSSAESVRTRIDEEAAKAIAQAKGRVSHAEYTWTGNTMRFSATAMGATVKGTVDITDTQVVLDAQVPFFLRAFEGRAKSRILERFREMFG